MGSSLGPLRLPMGGLEVVVVVVDVILTGIGGGAGISSVIPMIMRGGMITCIERTRATKRVIVPVFRMTRSSVWASQVVCKRIECVGERRFMHEFNSTVATLIGSVETVITTGGGSGAAAVGTKGGGIGVLALVWAEEGGEFEGV